MLHVLVQLDDCLPQNVNDATCCVVVENVVENIETDVALHSVKQSVVVHVVVVVVLVAVHFSVVNYVDRNVASVDVAVVV